MTTRPFEALAEELSSMADAVPDAVAVVHLDQPDTRTVNERLSELTRAVSELAGFDGRRPRVETHNARTVMDLPGRLRATGYHASGAMSVTLGLAPFEELFPADPGPEDLTALTMRAAEHLGLQRLVPRDDALDFERLWRIRAAGGDEAGTVTEPVLCRAVGAFRHAVHGLPVYGRASATVEVADKGRLASVSVALRRFAGDDGGETVAETAVRKPQAAADEVAARVAKAFRGAEDLGSVRLVPEWFRFGYLSLGRRQAQRVLAPFYIASVAVEHELERTAHVIAVAGSEDQFMRLPVSRRPSARRRTDVRATSPA